MVDDKNTSDNWTEYNELYLDPNKEIKLEDSTLEIVDFEPKASFGPIKIFGVRKQLPKNYAQMRKRHRKIQKKSRKINNKKK